MSYQKNYPNGWQAGEAGGTPITPEALNNIEDGIANALPLSGGKINGELWIGDNLNLKTDNEGGRIRIYPPNAAESGVDFWEIDSYNGKNLRIFADRNSNHELGDGYGFALSLDADGSIRAGNSAKTRENLSVAPSGYGLGTESGKAVEFSKLDTAKAFGMWSVWTGGTLNNISFTFAKMLVLPLDSNSITQILFPVGLPGCVLTRDCLGGVWGPWACYNPPMQVGVEYRTTERWCDEVVYRKLVSYAHSAIDATSTNKDFNIPHGISNFKKLVYCLATKDTTYQFPFLASSMGGAGANKVDASNIVFRVVSDSYSAGTLYFDIKYTKTA